MLHRRRAIRVEGGLDGSRHREESRVLAETSCEPKVGTLLGGAVITETVFAFPAPAG